MYGYLLSTYFFNGYSLTFTILSVNNVMSNNLDDLQMFGVCNGYYYKLWKSSFKGISQYLNSFPFTLK